MTTTLQQIQDRAVGYSSANGLQSLVSSPSEIINQIANFQKDLYDLAAANNRYFFAVGAPVISTAGASGRTIDLSALSLPLYRLLAFVLNDGRPVDQVDIQDLNAELAPRYYVLGKTMYEVSNDWSASSGAVSGTLTYMRGPVTLSVLGDLTQTLSIDDDFTNPIEIQLAYYLAHKDVGRDPLEIQRLEKAVEEAKEQFVTHMREFAGVESRRFNIPTTGDKD